MAFDPGDQVEQLELHLGGQPTEDRELDAPLLAAEVPPPLAERAHRPRAVSEHLPGVELVGLDDRRPVSSS